MDELDYVIYTITAIFLLISATFPLRRLKHVKSRGLMMFALAWIAYSTSIILEMVAYLIESEWFIRISLGIAVPMAIVLWSLFIDYAYNDQVTARRTSIVIVVAMLSSVWALDTSHAISLVDGVFAFDDEVFPLFSALSEASIAYSFGFWALKLNDDASVLIKRKTRPLAIVGLIGILLNTLNIMNAFFHFGDDFIETLLSVCMFAIVITIVYVIYTETNVLYFLPYRVYKLLVTDKKSGTPVFSYKWFVEKAWDNPFDYGSAEDGFMAGFISVGDAFSTALKETTEIGNITEMKMKDGIFIINTRSEKLNFGLVSSRSSKELRDSLDSFSESFSEQFSKELEERKPLDESRVKNLVSKCFANISIRVGKF